MVVLLVVPVVLLLVLARRRRRARRAFSADVLSDVLGTRQPYSGPRWRTDGRWL